MSRFQANLSFEPYEFRQSFEQWCTCVIRCCNPRNKQVVITSVVKIGSFGALWNYRPIYLMCFLFETELSDYIQFCPARVFFKQPFHKLQLRDDFTQNFRAYERCYCRLHWFQQSVWHRLSSQVVNQANCTRHSKYISPVVTSGSLKIAQLCWSRIFFSH